MTATDTLPSFEVQDGIGRITLDDPATLNSLSPASFARLHEIYTEAGERAGRDVHALLLTARGRAFSAGAELSSLSRMQGEEPLGHRITRWMREAGNDAVKAWSRPPVPMVTAINGIVVGIAASLALAGDIVIAGRSASFKFPFLTGLGVMPDGGLSWTLPRLVGPARTRAMLLLGERISAEQAAEWGLIWRCVDDADLQAEALKIAERLSRLPHYAAREVRAALLASQHQDFDRQCDYEIERTHVLVEGPEFAEGMKAFVEKREPRFRQE